MPADNKNKKRISKRPVFITQDPAMKNLFDIIKAVARTQAPVFITGESGTGKEIVARLLHYHSLRNDKAFLGLNCGALPKDIVESELFGHEKGAFTGAVGKKKGYFEQADKGILFLDEIAEMSPEIQVKLLRVSELKTFRRLGGTEDIHTDVQIISATNQNVEKLMKSGDFREDLYYRLNVIEIYIPPLRDRLNDIPLLSEFYLGRYLQLHKLKYKRYSKKLMDYFMKYSWPGNVRELCNVIERCVIMCPDDVIDTKYLPKVFGNTTNISNKVLGEEDKDRKNYEIPLGTTMEDAEKIIISRTMSFAGNNISEAARILGVSRNTLHNKLSKYNAHKD
ncbi:MAG: sigma-54 dependent transcriptional regulator [Balneolales bacterium]